MRFIRRKKFAAKLGVDVSTLWRWERTIPGFPKKYAIGPNVRVYDEDEVDAYVKQTRVVPTREVRDHD